MADYDGTYDDSIEEDISALEDRPGEEALDAGPIVQNTGAGLDPGTPVYRLRLSYSNDTFLAAYKGGPLEPGSKVLVPTRYGRDLAQIMGPVRCLSSEIARIERIATADDLAKAERHKTEEKEALAVCRQKIEERRLDMKLVSVHYLLEEPKILFFFTAENRVDFRDLVKDLVAIFKTRIELRQIGVRDESRVVGGLGVCGRCFCCNAVSDKLKPVSIKMAKEQNLSLNSMKISGPCGRLLCCLAYEHAFYSEQRRLIPQEGVRLSYEGTTWKVTELNVASGRLTLSAEDGRVLFFPFCRFAKKDGAWYICQEE
ncbi:MAG: stage 0 sporulation family protein [Spirochaetaceae bacterium]|jgi:cell fate regulator YaaT (PSP1 superfamily)|nr:stage 0 sporulation family protein [Spirochaetaceae bacterium]